MSKKITRYIVRVYALIVNSNNEILISDEHQLNMRMTKFPGGGMHFGEGTIECLKREAMEEFGQEIEVLEHFYTTDYFQPTQFYNDAQLLSIYYWAKFVDPIRFKMSTKPFDFEKEENGAQSFRWLNVGNISLDEITFPVDKKVVTLLKKNKKINGQV